MEQLGSRPPAIVAPVPGRRSQAWVDRLARSECPALTARRARRSEQSGSHQDPIVWSQARGVNVEDADGNCYVDFTAGFGAAAIGHAHPAVVRAVHRQSDRLVHALGDLHPSDVKIELLERLASLAPFDDARVMLGLNGADAVEAALKTAMLATARPGILAFHRGYHGLHYGPLAACGYQPAFRAPFQAQLHPHVVFADFPTQPRELEPCLDAIDRILRTQAIGAILVEPVQGRGGVQIPPPGFFPALVTRARAHGGLVIADEIMTGLVRCGTRWQSTADGGVPDLVCVGKALGGGLPISACLGRNEVMAAWGDPAGEALHTATFFGHPISCAAALAALDVIEAEGLMERARETGAYLCDRLRQLQAEVPTIQAVRGVGSLIGVEFGAPKAALRIVSELLSRGYLTLPAGTEASVLQLVPPVTMPRSLIDGFIETLGFILRREAGS